jgi:hypothetical protein
MLVYCVIVYSLVVRYEESHLRNKYGSPYEEYLAQVPRWLPHVKRGQGEDSPGALRYFWPAFKTELHNIVLVLPFIANRSSLESSLLVSMVRLY